MTCLNVECEFCVICGAPIPEGRMVCINCEKEFNGEEE